MYNRRLRRARCRTARPPPPPNQQRLSRCEVISRARHPPALYKYARPGFCQIVRNLYHFCCRLLCLYPDFSTVVVLARRVVLLTRSDVAPVLFFKGALTLLAVCGLPFTFMMTIHLLIRCRAYMSLWYIFCVFSSPIGMSRTPL